MRTVQSIPMATTSNWSSNCRPYHSPSAKREAATTMPLMMNAAGVPADGRH
jgi:hypothetical protein